MQYVNTRKLAREWFHGKKTEEEVENIVDNYVKSKYDDNDPTPAPEFCHIRLMGTIIEHKNKLDTIETMKGLNPRKLKHEYHRGKKTKEEIMEIIVQHVIAKEKDPVEGWPMERTFRIDRIEKIILNISLF